MINEGVLKKKGYSVKKQDPHNEVININIDANQSDSESSDSDSSSIAPPPGLNKDQKK